jgi:hypothetical protein
MCKTTTKKVVAVEAATMAIHGMLASDLFRLSKQQPCS